MASFKKKILSGSTDGRNIEITQTSTLGTTIHTGPSTTTILDEIYLYATNHHTAAVDLTIEWGAVTSTDDLIKITIPIESGLTLVVPGLLIQGNASPLIVTAFASVTAVVNINGFVNEQDTT